METGKEAPAIIIEPIVDPVPRETPAPEVAPTAPTRERDPIPA